jgi:hypothetical protein
MLDATPVFRPQLILFSVPSLFFPQETLNASFSTWNRTLRRRWFVELESAIRVAGFICGVPEAIWFLFNSGEGIFLYDWWPLLRRGHLYEKLSRMRVEVRKRGE